MIRLWKETKFKYKYIHHGYDEKGLAPSIYQGNLKVPEDG